MATYKHKQVSIGFTILKNGRDDTLWLVPRYEPEPRLHGTFKRHGHRFPIKDGISMLEAKQLDFQDEMIRQITKPNPILEHFNAR